MERRRWKRRGIRRRLREALGGWWKGEVVVERDGVVRIAEESRAK